MFIKVKAYPNSKTEKIIKKAEDAFIIRVKEKPKNNEANFRIFEILSIYLNVPKGDIRLIKGAKEQSKIFEIKI